MWKFKGYEIDEPIDWDYLCSKYDWLEEMKTVEQEPEWHGEITVFNHTRMVIEHLVSMDEFKNLYDEDKHILFAAALMHDIEKRSTTVMEDGKLRSPGHSKKGSHTARVLLYRSVTCSFNTREQIVNLIKNHGKPIWAIDKKYPDREVIDLSLKLNNKLLYILAKADVAGRICKDDNDYEERIEMFKDLCVDNDCFDTEKRFDDVYHRYSYLNKPENGFEYKPFIKNKEFKVTMMCALPGTGKDYYIENKLNVDSKIPVISLDDIRREHGIKHGDKKGNGQVIQLAKEKVREYLRDEESFIFNATNITRDMRSKWLSLFTDYNAITEIIYLEVPFHTMIIQNSQRSYTVPEIEIYKMMRKVEVPEISEAHIVKYDIRFL